jgi:hypothetical protein
MVSRPGGLRRRHSAAALDGSTAVVGLGSRRWTLEAGGARPPFLALAPDQDAIERRCRPTGSPCRDLDLRADLDGPQRGATVLGCERDPIAPVGWTPDDCSASHRDDAILSNASRLDALTKWWGEGTPRNSHVEVLGSGLSQAPTAQRPCREVVRLPYCRDGLAAPRQPDLDLRPPAAAVKLCSLSSSKETPHDRTRTRTALGTPLAVDPAPVGVVLQVGARFTMRRHHQVAPSCAPAVAAAPPGAQPDPFRHHLDVESSARPTLRAGRLLGRAARVGACS